MKLKQDDIIKVKIIDQGMDGEGIAKQEDYILFIPYALPLLKKFKTIIKI